MAIITLTSDLQEQDYYVPIIKGMLLNLSENLHIVDVSHQIPVFDIFKGAEILQRTYPYFPANTIHCMLVNPGNPADVRLLIARFRGHYFIGPDNGFFSFIFKEPPEWLLETNTPNNCLTFPFGDGYLQAISGILSNKDFRELGTITDKYLEKTTLGTYERNQELTGHFWHVDAFGNGISNITLAQFNQLTNNRKFTIEIRGFSIDKISRHYQDTAAGGLLALFNFAGVLEIAVNSGNASRLIGFSKNDRLTVKLI